MTTRTSNRILGAIAILAVAGAFGCNRKSDVANRTTDTTVVATDTIYGPASGTSSAMTTDSNATNLAAAPTVTTPTPAASAPKAKKSPVKKAKPAPESAAIRSHSMDSSSGTTVPEVIEEDTTTYYFTDEPKMDTDLQHSDSSTSGMTSPDTSPGYTVPWCTSKNRTIVDCPAGWRDHMNQ